MEFFSKYGPEDLNNKVYTQKYDHGINVQEVFERLVPLWGMRETITSFGETFPEVKGSLDNIVKRINDYEDAVKEDLNSFSANPEMYASNIKVKTDTLVAGLKVDINDVYIKVFDKHRDLADGVELLVTLNTVNDVMMGRSKKSKQAYYNKIIAQKNNLQRDITDYPDASLEDIINRHHDVEGTISSYYEKISIIGNFSHTVSEDLITTSEEEARALAYKPSNEVITTITGIKGNMTALGDRILALRDRINATKTTWFDSPEFRNFKRILNEKADLIHNSEEWSRQCNSQALDNMLKDLYKAADDYYFAKLGQSHNSRRSERFDIAAEMRELASTAMEKVRTPNADFTSDKKQLDIKKIFDKRAYHLAKVHVGKGMEPKSEDVYDNGKTDFENAKESEQGFLLNGMSSAELKKLADSDLSLARSALMNILCNYGAYLKTEIVLVFDAYRQSGNMGKSFDYHNIHVVYTNENETGDLYIEKFVSHIGKNERVRVVTSDNLIRVAAMRSGVIRVTSQDFEKEVEGVLNEITAKLNKTEKTRLSDIARILYFEDSEDNKNLRNN